MDSLMTSQSITARTDFPDFEKFCCDDCVCTEKDFLECSVEEQRAQKYEQIAYMMYEYFRATRACEAVQGLSDLFSIRLQNDDVQDFDTRWYQYL